MPIRNVVCVAFRCPYCAHAMSIDAADALALSVTREPHNCGGCGRPIGCTASVRFHAHVPHIEGVTAAGQAGMTARAGDDGMRVLILDTTATDPG